MVYRGNPKLSGRRDWMARDEDEREMLAFESQAKSLTMREDATTNLDSLSGEGSQRKKTFLLASSMRTERDGVGWGDYRSEARSGYKTFVGWA